MRRGVARFRELIVSRGLPKIYGEHTTTEIKGEVNVKHQNVDDLELARWIAHRLMSGIDAQRGWEADIVTRYLQAD